MLAARPDWCLSRQRLWGVPIPVLYCKDCGRESLTRAQLDLLCDLVAAEGADAWFIHPAEELLPPGAVCAGCGGTTFRKDTDILDVWFDSGISHRAVLDRNPHLSAPADLYLEGSDQHRGWFNVSLLTGIALRDAAPYKTVVTHGWTLTESGEKESKSKGNFTDPEWVCNEMGADILRLWVGSVNYMQDVIISPNLLKQMGEAYRRIRNTFKFLLGNLHDFAGERDALPYAQLLPVDQWMLHRLEDVLADATAAYEAFEFYRVFHAVHTFCSVDLSALYCDILKDRLYVSKADGRDRRSAQTVLRRIAVVLAKLLAPIIPFTMDEVWEYLRATSASAAEGTSEDTVHLSAWPAPAPTFRNAALAADFERLTAVRNEVLRELEKLRQQGVIGASLEARVQLYAEDAELRALLARHAAHLAEWLIVSHVELAEANPRDAQPAQDVSGLWLVVCPAADAKCARCWNHAPSVGAQASHPDLCRRCVEAINAA